MASGAYSVVFFQGKSVSCYAGESCCHGKLHEVSHAVHVKLLHDPGSVCPDGLLTDSEVLGDGPAGIPSADMPEDLALSWGEFLSQANVKMVFLAFQRYRFIDRCK